MVARPGTERTNFNAGEISKELWDRPTVEQWYAAAAFMARLEPVPQGGCDLTGGSLHRGWTGRQMAANGAVAGGVVAGVTTAGLVATIDFGTARAIAGLDLTGFLASQAIDNALVFEVTNNPAVSGTVIAPALNVRTTARTRRIAFAPGAAVTGRYIRIMLAVAPPSSTTFTIGTVTALAESFSLVARLRRFGVTRSEAYVLSMSAGHVDVFEAGIYVGCASVPYSAAQVAEVTFTQRFDVMLVWHPNVSPWRILRSAGDHDWQSDAIVWTNIPTADLGGSYSNAVAERWAIYLTYTGTIAGQQFVINVDGDNTNAINVAAGPDWNATAASIQTEINALAGVGSGATVTASAATGVTTFEVTFGGQNAGEPFSVTGQVISTTSAAITTGRRIKGIRAGEPIMSASRGWPRCGVFYGDRLFIGGFRSKPSAYAASAPGEYFDLNIDVASASGPILDNLDTDGPEAILHFVRSKQLVAMTDSAGRYLSNRAVTRTDPRNWVFSTNDGIAASLDAVESESSVIFVNNERTALLAATYSDTSLGYDVAPISLLASHLIDNVVSMSLQKAASQTDSQRLWMVRGDGLLVIGLLIRNQDVTAFVRWPTDGFVRSVSVDANNLVTIVVERQVAGVARLVLETIDPSLFLDQTITQTFGSPTSVVTGLSALEGASVWAIADGYVEGPFTVTGGQISLAQSATSITVGRWTPPVLTTLPLSTIINGRDVVLKRPKRVHTVRVKLADTTSIAIGANEQPAIDQPLPRFGDPVDQPPISQDYLLEAAGLEGFSDTGQVTITQKRPGKLKFTAVTTEAKT